MAKKRSLKSRKSLFLATGLIVVAALAAGIYVHAHNASRASDGTNPSSDPTSDTINYAPPTAAQKKDGSDHKASSVAQERDSTTGTTSPNSKKVSATITSWNQTSSSFVVRGFVAGIVEGSGTCTLKLTSGSNAVTQSSQAVANATNTSCGGITVPLTSLHTGTWQATLSYSSADAQGISSVRNVEVN